MSDDPFVRLKLKKGETKVVRADLIANIRRAEQKDASVLALHEAEAGQVLAIIPDDKLSDLVTAALHAILIARNPARTGEVVGPVAAEVSRAIPADRLEVLDPQVASAPQGHAVLEFRIGSVPIQVSASTAQWRAVLEALTRSGADHGTAH